MQRLVLVFLLAGCPAPSRYVVADVTAARVPLAGALVAADCTGARFAQRTDEDGRARVRIVGNRDACSLLVAKPGYRTVETGAVDICPPGACAPTRIDLGGPPRPIAPYAPPTERRPLEVAQ